MGEVELFQGLEHGEAGVLDAPGASVVLAQGGLAFQQAGKELRVRPLAGGSQADQVFGMITHVGKLELVETAAQLFGAGVFTLTHDSLLLWDLN
jgi:hypothetical protein